MLSIGTLHLPEYFKHCPGTYDGEQPAITQGVYLSVYERRRKKRFV
jgi:hypothetical protein